MHRVREIQRGRELQTLSERHIQTQPDRYSHIQRHMQRERGNTNRWLQIETRERY